MSQRVVAIIQARNGNDRLPGKGSLPLLGKPMVHHVISRVCKAQSLDEVIVAIPGAPEDETLKQTIIKRGVKLFIGRENGIEDWDIIRRYLAAAKQSKANWILRIAADNPCIMWTEIDHMAQYTGWQDPKELYLRLNSESPNCDTCSYLREIKSHDGFGAELWSYEMLRWFNDSVGSKHYREQPEKFWWDIKRYGYIGRHDGFYGLRLDVNTEADYRKIECIYNHFGHNRFTIDEVLEFLNDESSNV